MQKAIVVHYYNDKKNNYPGSNSLHGSCSQV
ncbi:hypothetical protein J2X61_007234 [Bacillus sp. 3255]|nr:hypothetical protein [Bacillus sp. 3255]